MHRTVPKCQQPEAEKPLRKRKAARAEEGVLAREVWISVVDSSHVWWSVSPLTWHNRLPYVPVKSTRDRTGHTVKTSLLVTVFVTEVCSYEYYQRDYF